MALVPEEPGLPDVIAEQGGLLFRLRAVVEAKDAENAVLRQELDAERPAAGPGPGCHCTPQPDANSRHPVNGHLISSAPGRSASFSGRLFRSF